MYGFTPWSTFLEGSQAVDPERLRSFMGTTDWRLRAHVLSVEAGVDAGTGWGLQLMAPLVRADSRRQWDGVGPQTGTDAAGTPLMESGDQGLGDVELRLRGELGALLGGVGWPRLWLHAGGVAPTGHFIVKGTADTSRYVSVGRGVAWALAGLDVADSLGARWGYLAQASVRLPFGTLTGNDGYLFRWGPEARLYAGPSLVLVPDLLTLTSGVEWQWRDSGEEQMSSSAELLPFANGGVDLWTASAGLHATLPVGAPSSLTASLIGRLPLYQEVRGIQPVPGPSVFAALSWSWQSAAAAPKPVVGRRLQPGEAPSSPLVSPLVQPGRVTLIDYTATWCAPCQQLAPKLEAYVAAHPDVVLHKVDATAWDGADLQAHLPGEAGLPVLDIYGRDGRLIARLVGPDCFGFAQRLLVP
jgi:thioredoxin 1